MNSRLSRFSVALLALGFVLGAGQTALAQAPLKAEDFNQFGWRWVGPVTFSGRISEVAVPPGQTTTYYVLGLPAAASGSPRQGVKAPIPGSTSTPAFRRSR